MANQQHLDILKQGINVWNKWRQEQPEIRPDLFRANLGHADLSEACLDQTNLIEADLSYANLHRATLFDAHLIKAELIKANLSHANLSQANLDQANLEEGFLTHASLIDAHLSYANLTGANLSYANLTGTHLSGANLTGADLHTADLSHANLSVAILRRANLSHANLTGTNLILAKLRGADLSHADLSRSNLSEAHCIGANLTGCKIYAISAWNVNLKKTIQTSLIITRDDETTITVDNLEVAQFIYLLLNNQKIREVIDTITSKVVLILGRFTEERKQVLDALKDELRKHNYLPVLFDFDKPASRDLTETVSTLAHLARFIIVDLTDPSSAPHEVATIIPQTIVPVQPLLTLQPLIVDGKSIERHEYAMFEDLRRRYHWVLPTFCYQDTPDLLASIQEHIIKPAEQKAKELAQR